MKDRLTDSVRSGLDQNGHLPPGAIDLEVSNTDENVIILTGRVKTYYQKQMAQEVARSVVQRLDVTFTISNRITVEDYTRRS